jgi:hypothetical protein
VPLTNTGVVVVTPNEEVFSLGHVVIRGIAVRFFGHGVDKPHAEIPHLERAFTAFN